MKHLDESYFKNADIDTEEEVEEIEQQKDDPSSYMHTMTIPVINLHSCREIHSGEELDERLSKIEYRMKAFIEKFVFITRFSDIVFIGDKKTIQDVLTPMPTMVMTDSESKKKISSMLTDLMWMNSIIYMQFSYDFTKINSITQLFKFINYIIQFAFMDDSMKIYKNYDPKNRDILMEIYTEKYNHTTININDTIIRGIASNAPLMTSGAKLTVFNRIFRVGCCFFNDELDVFEAIRKYKPLDGYDKHEELFAWMRGRSQFNAIRYKELKISKKFIEKALSNTYIIDPVKAYISTLHVIEPLAYARSFKKNEKPYEEVVRYLSSPVRLLDIKFISTYNEYTRSHSYYMFFEVYPFHSGEEVERDLMHVCGALELNPDEDIDIMYNNINALIRDFVTFDDLKKYIIPKLR